MSRHRALLFGGGLAVVFAVLPLLALVGGDDGGGPSAAPARRLAPQLIAQAGPLADGTRISVREAKALSPYRVAIPPTNETTGELRAVWIDSTEQIAFVWGTDLRFYVSQTGDITVEESLAEWTTKAASGDGVLVTVRGVPAVGRDPAGGQPSSLSLLDNGLTMQFVSDAHSLDDLRRLAEGITFE